jgi:peptidoglycan/LPS O-acetylase OafA/YrhL
MATPDRKVEPFSAWLDFFRWASAFVVVWSHAGGKLLLRSDQVADATLVHLGYSFIAGYAHYAVMVFFVMSGYLVGGSAWAELRRTGSLDLGGYAAKRVLRLVIVLYPTLLLTTALVPLSRLIWPGAFQGVAAAPSTLACNAVFLQEALCTVYGGNDSLWSLFHEFWYYSAFPFVALGLAGKGPTRIAWFGTAAILLGLLGVLQVHQVPILPYFGIWLLGFVIAAAPRPRVLPPPWLAGTIFVTVTTAVRMNRDDLDGVGAIAADFAIAIAFATLLTSLKWRSKTPPPLSAVHAQLASFSYSLYCVHIPLLVLYSAICMRLFGVGADMDPDSIFDWLIVAVGLAFATAGALAMYHLTEKHTATIRDAMFRRRVRVA